MITTFRIHTSHVNSYFAKQSKKFPKIPQCQHYETMIFQQKMITNNNSEQGGENRAGKGFSKILGEFGECSVVAR